MADLTVFHYPNCSTCKKARKWLDDHDVEYELVDIVTRPPSLEQLAEVHRRSGLPLRKLFNTSGVSYREGRFGERLPSMRDDQSLAALAADGKLIKRPIVLGPDVVLVGFSEAAYAEAFTND